MVLMESIHSEGVPFWGYQHTRYEEPQMGEPKPRTGRCMSFYYDARTAQDQPLEIMADSGAPYSCR